MSVASGLARAREPENFDHPPGRPRGLASGPDMWATSPELALLLDDGRGAARPRSDVAAGFRTGGVAVFELTTPFTEIAPGTATLSDYVVPGR